MVERHPDFYLKRTREALIADPVFEPQFVEAIDQGSGGPPRGTTQVFMVFVYTTKVDCTVTLVPR